MNKLKLTSLPVSHEEHGENVRLVQLYKVELITKNLLILSRS